MQESDFFTPRGEYKVDKEASETMKNSLMYKMSYYRFPELYGGQPAMDRVRNQQIPEVGLTLDTLGKWQSLLLGYLDVVRYTDDSFRELALVLFFTRCRRSLHLLQLARAYLPGQEGGRALARPQKCQRLQRWQEEEEDQGRRSRKDEEGVDLAD